MTLPAIGGSGFSNGGRNNIISRVFGTTRYQATIYYDPNRYVVVAKREMPNGDWSGWIYDGTEGRPSLRLVEQAASDNAHFVTTIGIDSDGYVHFVWDGARPYNLPALQYRRSTAPIWDWDGSVTANLAMTGVAEDNYNYPSFVIAPNGDLYFTHRDGNSPSSDVYLKKYDPSTETWAGVGATDGLIIKGRGTTRGTHCQAPICMSDDFDGAGTGRMWFVWNWRDGDDGTNDDFENTSAAYWTGTAWKKPDGSAQASPITLANCAIINPISVATTGTWPGNAIYNLACSADGTQIAFRYNHRNWLNGIWGGTVVTVDTICHVDGSGTVTFNAANIDFQGVYWDRDEEKFAYVYPDDNGNVYRAYQTTGASIGALELLGTYLGNGINAATHRWAIDREYLLDTGRINARVWATGSGSSTPTFGDYGSFVDVPMPSTVTYGGSTSSYSVRYNEAAATVETLVPR